MPCFVIAPMLISKLTRSFVYFLSDLFYVAVKKAPVAATPRYNPASVYGPSVVRKSNDKDNRSVHSLLEGENLIIYICIV